MIEIYNENCLDGMKRIKDKSIDLIVTDPPYKIITGGNSDGKNSTRPKGVLSGNRKLFKGQNIIHAEWLKEAFRILKDSTHCYVFTNTINLKQMLIDCEDIGFKLHNILVWEKNNCTPSQYYMKNAEYILFLRKGKAKYINNIGKSKTVHQFNNIIGNKVHPTEKPVDLMRMYVENSSDENDLVLDPFMGSGTTGIACVSANRNFIGFEIDKEYFDIAKDRIESISEK